MYVRTDKGDAVCPPPHYKWRGHKNPLVYKGLKHSGFIRPNNVSILFHCSFLITHLSVKSQVTFSLGTVSTPFTVTYNFMKLSDWSQPVK